MNDYGQAVRELLGESGCVFHRRGKGDHDIWRPSSGKPLVAPFRIKSRHTTNGILKDAGLPKQF